MATSLCSRTWPSGPACPGTRSSARKSRAPTSLSRRPTPGPPRCSPSRPPSACWSPRTMATSEPRARPDSQPASCRVRPSTVLARRPTWWRRTPGTSWRQTSSSWPRNSGPEAGREASPSAGLIFRKRSPVRAGPAREPGPRPSVGLRSWTAAPLVEPGRPVDGYRVLYGNAHGGHAAWANTDCRTRALALADAAVDDVAVCAGLQPGVEGPGLRGGFVVDADPAPIAAAEGDQVDAVVGPVSDRRVADVVVPADHVRHARVAVHAHPAVAAVGVGDEAVRV